MISRFAALVLVAAAFGSCRRPPAPVVDGGASAPPSDAEVKKQLAAAVQQLAAVRGLSVKHDVALKVLSTSDYRSALVERTAAVIADDVVGVEALWAFLNFADAKTSVDAVARQVVDDAQVEAFYDVQSASVVLKQPTAPTYDASASVAVVMALERALQCQHFGAPPAGVGVSVDDNLPRLALREGDAAAASFAYFAARAGKPAAEAITRAAALLDSLPVDALATSVGYSRDLARAPILVRDELARARPAGLQLVSALMRAGGFALVDRALASPPTSMLEMYDPQLYVRGWQPMKWPSVNNAAHLGVVGVLAFVERCQRTDRAKAFVPDWRGDAYTAASSGVFVWRTAWKDAAAAARFADEVSGNAQCRAPTTTAAAHFEALRRGAVVAVSNSSDASVLEKAVAAAPVPNHRAPPLGDAAVELTPATGPRYAGRPMLSVQRSGTLKGNSYENPRLGFTATVPPGFDATADEILAIDRAPPSLASGRVTFEQSDGPFASPADFFSRFADRISKSFFRGAPLAEIGSGDEQTPFGRASFRVYEMRTGRVARVRVLALPICKGAAALVVALVFMDDAGEALLNGWVRSFRPTAATVCSALTAP